MIKEKKIYVVGHRNPDTDSVVSAAAYSRLKQMTGWQNCAAARAGKLSPQTEYVFHRFGVPVPEYLPDLVPKAEHYLTPTLTVDENTSAWEALEILQKEDLRALPVVDRDGNYKSMFHYRGFARYIAANINPHRKSAFPLSLESLAATINARPVTIFNGSEIRKSTIIVAASYRAYFKKYVQAENMENALVIVGDRWDIQKYCLEKKARALILSGNNTLSAELAALAEKNCVTVLSSPYDTSSTAMLIMYSVSAGTLGDPGVPPVRLHDPVRTFREKISKAPARCLPVTADGGKVCGVVFESDLAEEPNVSIIMVDHNESSQALEGIENFRILEVIDHHRLGNFSTRYPITFINRTVGATCTIIAGLYREQKMVPEKDIASILLCGILADTLALKSATATDSDRETAQWLASLAGLDIAELGRDLQKASSRIDTLSAGEITELDMKEYSGHGQTFTVSQVETDDPLSAIERRAEIENALEKARAAKNRLFCALLVTDVTRLDSLLFVRCKNDFSGLFGFPVNEQGIFELKGVVSRKKQLVPLLSELVEKAFP